MISIVHNVLWVYKFERMIYLWQRRRHLRFRDSCPDSLVNFQSSLMSRSIALSYVSIFSSLRQRSLFITSYKESHLYDKSKARECQQTDSYLSSITLVCYLCGVATCLTLVPNLRIWQDPTLPLITYYHFIFCASTVLGLVPMLRVHLTDFLQTQSVLLWFKEKIHHTFHPITER